MKNRRLQLLRRIGAPLIIVVLLFVFTANIQAIKDYVKLRGYTASPLIARIVEDTTMTDKARTYFYVNHPEVDDRQAFNKACGQRGEQTIVLGCYHTGDNGIFIFDIDDPRLEGVEQVTAAHEMLHAAYERLSDDERADIDSKLQYFYDTKVTDERIRRTMAAYEKSEPKDIVNELHSIFATEISALTPELENYYKRYFSDRSKVVELAGNYQAEFTSRQDQVAAYDAQLSDLKSAIDANSAELEQQQTSINNQRRQMEDLRDSGNVAAYNARVTPYNTAVDNYNSLVQRTQNAIATYNELVKKRNDLALEVKQLTQSISSQPSTIGQ